MGAQLRKHKWWLIGGIAYLLFALLMSGLLPKFQPLTFGITSRYSETPPKSNPQNPDSKGCTASVIEPSSLLLRCSDALHSDALHVEVLEGVETLPLSHKLGAASKETLEKALISPQRSVDQKGSAEVSCLQSAADRACIANAADLRLLLLNAGLAAVMAGRTDLPPDLGKAEKAARDSHIGLWYDPPPDTIDPILWRLARDASFSNAASVEVQRASTFASFLGVAMSVFLGYWAGNVLRDAKVQDAKKKYREYWQDAYKMAQERAVRVSKELKKACSEPGENWLDIEKKYKQFKASYCDVEKKTQKLTLAAEKTDHEELTIWEVLIEAQKEWSGLSAQMHDIQTASKNNGFDLESPPGGLSEAKKHVLSAIQNNEHLWGEPKV